MSHTVVNIDANLFLDTPEDFFDCYLPAMNAERVAKGLAPLTGQDALNEYLDQYFEYRLKKNEPPGTGEPVADQD